MVLWSSAVSHYSGTWKSTRFLSMYSFSRRLPIAWPSSYVGWPAGMESLMPTLHFRAWHLSLEQQRMPPGPISNPLLTCLVLMEIGVAQVAAPSDIAGEGVVGNLVLVGLVAVAVLTLQARMPLWTRSGCVVRVGHILLGERGVGKELACFPTPDCPISLSFWVAIVLLRCLLEI